MRTMKRYMKNSICMCLFSLFALSCLISCQSDTYEFIKEEGGSNTTSTKAADLYEKTVEVKDAGTLEKQLTADEMGRVENLTISGNLNATDVETFRKKLPRLNVLNLKKVKFVENDTLTYTGYQWYYSSIIEVACKIKENSISGSMFSNMTTLTKVILPENITELGFMAFWNCKSLTSVEFPERIKKVESSVFEDCTNLTSMDLSCFDEMGTYMFSRCNLQSIVLPANLRIIPAYSFRATGNLKINIPESVTKIEEGAFNESKLTSITIPNSVKDFGNSIFLNCKSLENAELPTSMSILPESMFNGCSALKEIKLPEGLTSIANAAFCRAGLVSLDMPNTVETVGDRAFESCPLTGDIKLSSSLKTIGNSVFVHCKFEAILLPNKLETIGGGAFYENDMLRTITIPASVKNFGSSVFSDCDNLTSIFWNSTIKVPTMWYLNPTCLLYLSSEAIDTGESGLVNIVVNGVCAKLTLVDGSPFECLQEFKTQEVVFTRNFQKATVPGKSDGWYGLSLPFDVDKIIYNENELTPFNQTNKEGLHFWLRTLTETGYKNVEKIEKNKPYIIAIPNSSYYYDEEYNVHGNVTFTAKNSAGITIPKDIALASQKGPDYSLIGTFTRISKRATAYPINDAGTAFQASIRDVSPFEAYAINNPLNSSARSFAIGNGSQTRSFHPVGRKPSITDM